MKVVARIKILTQSNKITTFINSERNVLSRELGEVSRTFDFYIGNDYYSNIRSNPQYHSFLKFQNSLAALFNTIGEITEFNIKDLETLISTNLRHYTYRSKKIPSTEVNTVKFVKLYNTLKINYKDQLKQHGLEQEFEKVFFD